MPPVELHAHSHYSFLDALASPEQLVSRAGDLGYSALALTDHGGLFGVPRFLRAAQESKIKPVIGCEVYVSPTTRSDRSADLRPVGHHLTLLAETVEGYKNLVALSSAGYAEGFFFRPRIDREMLAAHAAGLILLTGCIHSALCESVLKQDTKAADRIVGFYLDAFGRDRVFVEIQRHGLDEEETLLEHLSILAKKHRLPKVATNDVHYLNPEDAEAQRIAMDMRSRKLPTDPRRARFLKPAYGLRTAKEWSAAFGKDHPDALETAQDIAARCRVTPEDLRFHESLKQDPRAASRLKEVVETAARRLGHLTSDVNARLSEELTALRAAGLSEYFLMIHDLMAEARSRGLSVGPGRGSSAGSMVAYLLDITEVNPMEYQLSFERFLSPSRKTLPDVDIDVDFRERDRMVEIMNGIHPSARTFRAGTVSGVGLKTSIREVARSRGMPYREVDDKIRSLPAGATRLDPEDAPPWKEMSPVANAIASIPKSAMGHPTALISVPATLVPFLAAYTSPSGQTWLQFDGDDLDWMGVPRVDILPLKILAVLSETVRWLKISGLADIDWPALPLSDPETFQMLARGETVGLFQMESPGVRELLRRISPDSIESLAAVLALYRPGPIEADLPRMYIDRKNGQMERRPPHPMFESILRETFGLILYQEQVIACARSSGLNAVDADEFRIAVSKKNPELMKRACEKFSAALKATVSDQESAALVSQMTRYAAFAFNKAHAVSYAILCYRAAYLKARFPAAFLASLANMGFEDRGQLGEIFSEARRLGIQILPPRINEALADCVPEPDGRRIRIGIRLIRHLTDDAVAGLLQARPFSDVADVLMKVPALSNPQALQMLCKSGALDAFGARRKDILASLPEKIERVKQSSKLGGWQTDLFGQADAAPSPASTTVLADPAALLRENLMMEHESLGCFATGSPMDDVQDIVSEFCSGNLADLAARGSLLEPERPDGRKAAGTVTAAGLLTTLRLHVDRSGRDMAFATIEDGTGSLDVVLFHDAFEGNKSLLSCGTSLLVRGRLEKRGVSATLVVDQVVGIDQPERLYESVLLRFDEDIGMDVMRKVKEALKEYPGDRPIYVEMSEGGSAYEFRIGWSCRPSVSLRRRLVSLLGRDAVSFLKTREGSPKS